VGVVESCVWHCGGNGDMVGKQLVRLTLFTGRRCSLCDTAKSELAKVREKREFELQTVDIHAKGSERWMKEYGWTIPVLHVNDAAVLKGLWAEKDIIAALDDVTK